MEMFHLLLLKSAVQFWASTQKTFDPHYLPLLIWSMA